MSLKSLKLLIARSVLLSLFIALPLPMLMPHGGFIPVPSFVISAAFADQASHLIGGNSSERLMPAENPKSTYEQKVFMINSRNTTFELLRRSVNASSPASIGQSHLRAESILLEKPLVRRQINSER